MGNFKRQLVIILSELFLLQISLDIALSSCYALFIGKEITPGGTFSMLGLKKYTGQLLCTFYTLLVSLPGYNILNQQGVVEMYAGCLRNLFIRVLVPFLSIALFGVFYGVSMAVFAIYDCIREHITNIYLLLALLVVWVVIISYTWLVYRNYHSRMDKFYTDCLKKEYKCLRRFWRELVMFCIILLVVVKIVLFVMVALNYSNIVSFTFNNTMTNQTEF
ncbi:hypothetical protein NEFER03_1973 [Nematocida sp. LUAm3]|nr:hypothetical protein NEFER03_1973 [Nematocida sp. LUAm3]KAI5176057.1 hypothetical protein NEFER02_1891 [Nematocida sp. LUAm2]KAI5177101.1 hypothetical protein NEFER01_0376 [Nematocida sp. LUAm1]